MTATSKPELHIVLCSPRGFCAGVVRAIDTVERALKLYGPPVYVRHEIVHNRHVVESLRTKGAIFVEELDEIPDTDAPVVFSAHGVPKSIPAEAERRNFFALDATCPLVTKVHREAEIHFKRGREIAMIGHAGHPEVVGTLGQLPAGAVILIETVEQAKQFQPKDASKLAFVTQTTLSIDDTAAIVATLKARFPENHRAAQGRHLLRDHQPPARGEAGRAGGRCDDRRRLAELVELAASARGRRARRLPARGAGERRRRSRLVDVRRASPGSASPPAPRRRRCWSRRSSTRSRRSTRCTWIRCRRRPKTGSSSRCRGRCGPPPPLNRTADGGLHRRFRRRACGLSEGLRHRRIALLQGHRRRRREFQFPAPHQQGRVHPHAL